MTSVSTNDVVNLFKKVYGNLRDLQPEDYQLQKDMPFSQKEKVGDSYVEAMVLSSEMGFTLGGSGMEAFDLNPAVAGAVKQTSVQPYTVILSSIVPWGVLSRSAGGGERAFFDGTKHIVKNNLKSHGKILEVVRWYGQATELLGTLSYATQTYRGQAFTNGTGTLSTINGSITFTNGVFQSGTSSAILLAPGQYAAGIWVGSEGVTVEQLDVNNNVVASGKLLGTDADQGVLFVDFVPVAATSATSHKVAWQGQESVKDALGVNKILRTSGNLFGIDNTKFSLWKGNSINLNPAGTGGVKYTFDQLQIGVAQAVNRGGLDGDVNIYVNPRTWRTLISTEAGKRVYDKSYTPSEAENGMESITFYHQSGKAHIRAHRMVKEGDVFGLHLDDWTRSGSAEISFTVPGIDKEIIFPLENQAAMAFRSFSDQYVFCHAPARSIIWTGVNDESAT